MEPLVASRMLVHENAGAGGDPEISCGIERKPRGAHVGQANVRGPRAGCNPKLVLEPPGLHGERHVDAWPDVVVDDGGVGRESAVPTTWVSADEVAHRAGLSSRCCEGRRRLRPDKAQAEARGSEAAVEAERHALVLERGRIAGAARGVPDRSGELPTIGHDERPKMDSPDADRLRPGLET